MLGVAVVGAGVSLYQAHKGAQARDEEQRKANQELADRKAEYEDMDTSNPYANLENVYEDLTVNTQQAEMMNQQSQQQQANIMQGMNQAAGGSGVAGLAQQMANQGQLQAQQSSASIGQQETANQRLMLGESARLQTAEARGDRESQKLEMGKTETMFGMAQQRKISADAAKQRAADQQAEAMGQIVGGVAGMGMAGAQNLAQNQGMQTNTGEVDALGNPIMKDASWWKRATNSQWQNQE